MTVFIHQRVNRHVIDRNARHLAVHAASGTLNGKRFILAGDRRAGKTTLLTRLMFEGAEPHGDDLLIFKGELFQPFPRRFHIKSGSLDLLPQLKRYMTKKQSYLSGAFEFFFFDPTEAGFRWTCLADHVDTAFYLRPNHGGETRLRKCPKYLMARNLLRQVENYSERNRDQSQRMFESINTVNCYELELGDLEAAVREIKTALE